MMLGGQRDERQSGWLGRRIVVTGSAHGIGEAVARGAAALGAHVALADVDEAAISQVAAELRAAGREALAVATDVTDSQAVAELFEDVTRAWGGIESLVNCAGGFARRMGFEEIGDSEWHHVLDLNAFSTFACCRAALPTMLRAHYGRIVNVASDAGRTPVALSAAHYAAAKAAVLGLTRHLAREVAVQGICVNAVAPGTTLSERVRQITNEQATKALLSITPIGRLATVDEQVQPILFLASDAAAYITGATLDVSGGRVMM